MGGAYYNEIDPFAAQWLRNLIDAGRIAPGVVDERSIKDVKASDLGGYTQCHFFAGLGGWSYALRLAGWPDDRPVWTGSCPCQPFSAAGPKLGTDDPRHLWPDFHHLIAECRPPVVFGEQVARAAGLAWFDLVSADLEASGYAVGGVSVAAGSVGAPHLRQRLWWVADADGERRQGYADRASTPGRRMSARRGASGDMADAVPAGRAERRAGAGLGSSSGRGGVGAWDDVAWVHCRDGKARPTQPGIEPLAHGVSARVGRLRGYGNAIVPQVAAEVIGAYMGCAR